MVIAGEDGLESERGVNGGVLVAESKEVGLLIRPGCDAGFEEVGLGVFSAAAK